MKLARAYLERLDTQALPPARQHWTLIVDDGRADLWSVAVWGHPRRGIFVWPRRGQAPAKPKPRKRPDA